MEIKLGIIGLGAILKNHLQAIAAVPQFRLAGVCDADPQRCWKMAEECDVAGYTDYRQLLQQDIDVIAVTLPHHLHAQVALDAILAGCHVLLEKPVAINMQDLRRINEAIETSGCHVIPADSAYWQSHFQTARQIVRTHKLGDFVFGRYINYRYYFNEGRPDWFLDSKSSGGGQFCNIGIHRIAAVRCLLGGDLQESHVLASVRRIDAQYDIEAATSAMVHYDSGQAMTYEEVGYFEPPEGMVPREMHFVFQNGLLGIRDDYVWTSDPRGQLSRHEMIPEPAGGMYQPFYAQMLRAISSEPYYPDFELGARDVRIALAAYASAESGKPICLDEPEWQLGPTCSVENQEKQGP